MWILCDSSVNSCSVYNLNLSHLCLPHMKSSYTLYTSRVNEPLARQRLFSERIYAFKSQILVLKTPFHSKK